MKVHAKCTRREQQQDGVYGKNHESGQDVHRRLGNGTEAHFGAYQRHDDVEHDSRDFIASRDPAESSGRRRHAEQRRDDNGPDHRIEPSGRRQVSRRGGDSTKR